MVCAFIAYRDMKPQVRQRVAQILRQHPRYEKDLLREMPQGFADPDLYAFMKAATWPDMLREVSNPMRATHHHPAWHFIDFPLVAPADAATLHPPSPDLEGGEVDNILKALTKVRTDLDSANVGPPDKAIALCWLAHLIGDVHQPLHTATLFSAEYPQGDKGGNLFFVRAGGGEIVNLHLLWDGILGGQSSPRAIRLIAGDILANPACSRTALADELSHTGSKAWADESYADCREIVYNNFKLRGASAASQDNPPAPATTAAGTSELLTSRPSTAPASARGPQPIATPELPISYEAVARELASRRIALAGYRLADELNQLFGQP